MLRPLCDHLVSLGIQIQTLRDRLTDPNLTLQERSLIESKAELAQLALTRYREAFDLEQKIA